MDLQALMQSEQRVLIARLSFALGGDRDTAEDLVQEAFTRAWRDLPRDLGSERQRAWVHRTARNLAIDELRRRARRPSAAVEEIDGIEQLAAEPDAAREALAALTAHERFVLLLRFEAGFAHGEIARLLDTSEDAARKRVARARATFLNAYRKTRSDRTPLVLLLISDDVPEPYVRWLEHAGARVKELHRRPSERELALADGLVLTGARSDLHAGLYGEAIRMPRGTPNLADDRVDLAVLQAALAIDLPFAGVCRGHQLLNIASGGSLYQDVIRDGLTPVGHDDGSHVIATTAGGRIRELFGRSADVHSEHHQAIRRLGRSLQATASSPDGVVEAIERTDRRFAVGLQWHPERDAGGLGDRIAEALVAAAQARAA
jgi:anthranilate synthase component 2/putative glutamine amidotransferase